MSKIYNKFAKGFKNICSPTLINLFIFLILAIIIVLVYIKYKKIELFNNNEKIITKEMFSNTLNKQVKYVSNIKSIAIYLPTPSDIAQNYVTLSGIFIYDKDGKLINLLDSNIGTPLQSSTVSAWSSSASNAIRSLTFNPSRSLNHALSVYNTIANNCLGFNENILGSYIYDNHSHTSDITNDKPSYWIYNFTNPVSVTAVEIFTRTDCCAVRLNNLTINLYNSNITGNNATIQNFINNTTNTTNNIASGTYGKQVGDGTVLGGPPGDKSHKVFVIDNSLVPSTNVYIPNGQDNINIINSFTLSTSNYNNSSTSQILLEIPITLPAKYISGVNSILIYNPTNYVSLTGVFIYDNNGNIIRNVPGKSLQSTNYFLNGVTPDMVKSDNAFTSLNLQPSRTINNAVSKYNNYNNNFLGLNKTFMKWDSNLKVSLTTDSANSFWIYNFPNPVNISAVEIFTRNDDNVNYSVMSQINICLFDKEMLNYLPPVSNYNNNLLASGSFGTILQNNGTSSDNAHKVFVIDPSLVPSTNVSISSNQTNTNIINPFVLKNKSPVIPLAKQGYIQSLLDGYNKNIQNKVYYQNKLNNQENRIQSLAQQVNDTLNSK